MSKHIVMPALIAVVLLGACVTRYKVTYDIPANYPESRKKELIEICDKGKELFKMNCAQCHGVFNAGKEGTTNFSQKQIDNYSSRFIARDMKNHSVVSQMNPEQFNEVLMFLKFKKNDHPDTTAMNRDPRRRF